MSNQSTSPAATAALLDAEVRALRQRLAQREEALAVLNRRLLQLERGENGAAGMERAEPGNLTVENQRLHDELERIRHTKLFRWSEPARRAYGLLRGFR